MLEAPRDQLGTRVDVKWSDELVSGATSWDMRPSVVARGELWHRTRLMRIRH